ncbi:hypothetical protein DMB38_20570 [Streptomyces sp. WAC 06738]|uniref:hypothetical protein n=1 Tax=Streptomyces sp. WAC 06738 TaxID=2203210 RepID=UPI000F6E155C|nr:hypothetical protein [Streptomyces sp. WAC 06738]AZM47865.1 hypothetical protein DMB38_20570 [Streptomyces sp. WAC 06738]
MTQHVIQFSGGLGSFGAALWVAEKYGTSDMTLLIADTKAEDPDLWRFADDTSRLLGVPLTKVADGRNPWELFRDKRFLGNDRITPCTKYLKQIPCRKWMKENAPVDDSLVYIGIEKTKRDRARCRAIARNWKPWTVRFPLCNKWMPELGKEESKAQLMDLARWYDIEPPRLYALGYEHNNCGGLCVRAGQKQWLHTLEVQPERFAYAEAQEASLRELLGDVTMLRERRQGVAHSLPLSRLRRRQEAVAAFTAV